MTKASLSFGLLMLIFAGATNAFGQGAAAGQGLHRLTWPGKDWSVDVSVAPFTNTLEDSLKDGTGYLFVATLNRDNPAVGRILMLIIRVEAAKDKGSDRDVRDSAVKMLKKSEGVDAASVKPFEYKQIPVIKYAHTNPLAQFYFPYPGPPGAWKSAARGMEAFFVKDDVLITFRLNALALKKEDEQLFYAMLDSVKFTDTSNPVSSFDYYHKGKTLIRQKQYEQAAEHLHAALALEQKQRQLDDADWRKLIGHLLDIYAATGNRARVKELLDYGVSHDPTFPTFHLGLAIYYASLNDVDASIASLEKAYLYGKTERQSLLRFGPSSFWFDPMTHPAFEPFRKNEKFRKAVKAMKK